MDSLSKDVRRSQQERKKERKAFSSSLSPLRVYIVYVSVSLLNNWIRAILGSLLEHKGLIWNTKELFIIKSKIK